MSRLILIVGFVIGISRVSTYHFVDATQIVERRQRWAELSVHAHPTANQLIPAL
jgi:hypothetical protein